MPETTTRESLINALRTELVRRANGEMSICRLAAEQGIFCRGFRRFSDAELKARYGWISTRFPRVSREELEEIADRWQTARQMVDDLPTSCDVQQMEHDGCNGWDDFSDEELAGFVEQLKAKPAPRPRA